MTVFKRYKTGGVNDLHAAMGPMEHVTSDHTAITLIEPLQTIDATP